MCMIYAEKTNREHLRWKLGDRGVEIFDHFRAHGFDYMGFYTGFIRTKHSEYLKQPPNGYIIFPEGMRDPHASGCFGYMYRIGWGVDLNGEDGIILSTSFAPQEDMLPKYRLDQLDDDILQRLVSDKAKKMFSQWVNLRTEEMKSWRVLP